MKKILICITTFALLCAACNRLDVAGMFFSSGSHTEDRVQGWLDWNAQHDPVVITGVPDEYRVYVCSDPHISDSAGRVERFLDAEYRDGDAIFSIINGDISNENSERPYLLFDSVMRLPRPYNHLPGPAEDTCFTTIGNHDIYFDCETYYAQHYHTSTYTVTVQTVGGAKDLFIFLDSGNATHGRKQLEWLREVLAHRSDYRHVVVNTHTCLFRNSYNYSTTPAANLPEEEYYELVNMMDQNHVDLFLMGHFHHKEQHQIGRVNYVMTSNLDTEEEDPSYLIVTCGDEVTYRYKNL